MLNRQNGLHTARPKLCRVFQLQWAIKVDHVTMCANISIRGDYQFIICKKGRAEPKKEVGEPKYSHLTRRSAG